MSGNQTSIGTVLVQSLTVIGQSCEFSAQSDPTDSSTVIFINICVSGIQVTKEKA